MYGGRMLINVKDSETMQSNYGNTKLPGNRSPVLKTKYIKGVRHGTGAMNATLSDSHGT